MLMAYCIPYGYLAMNGDATSGTIYSMDYDSRF